ncbi:site-specific integrase [Christiangramia sp.]|uniref:site-specific integrase n=1 Tax=Christiangramia sp. TaxID=1931228 RepID=UPI00260B4A3C|nr:site-specific integrase [Christiangramia sp.]
MRSTKSFSILFWAYTSRAKNEQVKIYARITVNGKRANISLKQKADIKTWDSVRQRSRGNSESSRTLNQYLDQVHARLVQCYQDFKFKDQLITAELLKANYLGDGKNSKSLQDLIAYHNNKITGVLAKGSIRNFGITEKYINRFLKKSQKTTDVFLSQLNYEFICDFETFLHAYWPEGHPRAMSQNTVMKHIQRLRKIIRLGYNLEWLDKDPFRRWKPSFERREREFLTQEELQKLETYIFLIDRLDRVRDLFIFSCYTGISYADLIKLTKMNLHFGIDGKKWIITKRQKTKTPVKIPLLEKAHEILIKYDAHPVTQITNTLLPVISNEKLNLYLKEVADACGIGKNLTFHMSRHTFATTVTLSNGVPIETVSKLLGHTKITTTQIYARVLDQKISQDMTSLQKKLNEGKDN